MSATVHVYVCITTYLPTLKYNIVKITFKKYLDEMSCFNL